MACASRTPARRLISITTSCLCSACTSMYALLGILSFPATWPYAMPFPIKRHLARLPNNHAGCRLKRGVKRLSGEISLQQITNAYVYYLQLRIRQYSKDEIKCKVIGLVQTYSSVGVTVICLSIIFLYLSY